MLVVSVLEQGLIFGLLALGVYITYKILDFPDLTVDGSIVIGASVTAVFIIKDFNPLIATFMAILAGALAGLATGILHVHLKITNLLSGLLVMICLYSINLRIMGKPNIHFFSHKTIFSISHIHNKLIVLLIITLGVKFIIDLFLKTKLGMLLRITGNNPQLVTNLGVDIGKIKIMGLMIANALVALSGSLLSQYQRFSDINSGTGSMIIGFAAVIIGETIFTSRKKKFLKNTTTVILGAIVYKFVQAYTLQLGFLASDFKMITAIMIVIFISLSNLNLLKLKKVFVKC